MVFHETDSITDVLSGHRVIIYYIEGKLKNASKTEVELCKALETIMEMLEKKNDDLLIVKILYASTEFNQFKELYRPHVSGAVTLFVINNEGIPLMSENVQQENIVDVIESLCTTCKLNCIQRSDVIKIVLSEHQELSVNTEKLTSNGLTDRPMDMYSTQESSIQNSLPKSSSTTNAVSFQSDNKSAETPQLTFTELQICLPDGSRDKQKFNNDSLLQEVWIFIKMKYRLKDFDLKTFNRQAFSDEEYEKTLQDLDLYPNGVIIVVPKNVVSFNNNRGITAMVQYGFLLLMNKTSSVFRYIQGLLFMFWNSIFFPKSDGNRPTQRRINSGGSNNEQTRASSHKGSKTATKTFGNIHTLHSNDDSDDENNRYNGNSTQQK